MVIGATGFLLHQLMSMVIIRDLHYTITTIIPRNLCSDSKLIHIRKQPIKREKQIERIKKWLEYSGTVEYYVSESYPTIKDIITKKQFPLISPTTAKEGEPCVKRTTKARISIEPSYTFYPRNYAFWFDGIGVGINLNDFFFDD